MTVFGIGIDVVEVARIGAAIERRPTLLERLFTPAERAYCQSQSNPSRHFAARFAAKEAVAKALGTGIGGQTGWLDLEVVRNDDGRPTMVLHGAAKSFAQAHGITDVQVSLTHARAYAAANAVALGLQPSRDS